MKEKEKMKNNLFWIGYGTAWLATSAAVCCGIYFTGRPICLWAMVIPACIGYGTTSIPTETKGENDV